MLITDLEPTYREIFLSALVLLWFATGMAQLPGLEDWINTIGLISLSLILGWAGYRQLKLDIASLWTPLLWYRVATLSYFGIGSLVPIWTNYETKALIKAFYDFYPLETVKLNLLITVFHVVFLLTVKGVFYVIRDWKISAENSNPNALIHHSRLSMLVFGSTCMIIGSIVNYFVVFPQIVGWIRLPFFSTISNFSALAWVGYFMVTLWALRNGRRELVVLPIILAIGESAIGVFAMSKTAMLNPLIMLGIAFVYHRQSISRILLFCGITLPLILFLAPIITYARETNNALYSGSATVAEIPNIYASYFSNDRRQDQYSEVQLGWARLSYVNAGTFIISQYDHGLPGTSYRYWSIVWIPRVIYNNKPIITDVSRELSYAASGNYDTSSSAGLAAEAYWNGGWIAVGGIAIFVGLLFTLCSIYSFVVIHRQAWHLFFIVLIGMRMALRVDGAFVADILGPIALMVLAHVSLELINRFLPQGMARWGRPIQQNIGLH
ncbi:hypothetical protein [Sphingomonas pruni]|uniref:hypothetical protein n=1 Tax=Sphingomonas pruni TaxID=40683 RepID=UPI000829A333|nr:hypothetical protein [Sphingomonas pruni]